jgi:FMN phosphatase YigB (HAD superfamily)
MHFIPTAELWGIAIKSKNGMNLKEISNKTQLTTKEVFSLTKKLPTISCNIEESKYILKKPNVDLIIFDWSGTLIDDRVFDEELCDSIAKSSAENRTYVTLPEAKIEFRKLLDKLERNVDRRWYDYVYLAKEMGVGYDTLHQIHIQNFEKLILNPSAIDILNHFSNKYKLALATFCSKKSLEWRMEGIGMHGDIFDVILTSDKINNVMDKKEMFMKILDEMNVDPIKCLVVENNLFKGILPAKSIGCMTAWIKEPSVIQAFYGTPTMSPNLAYISLNLNKLDSPSDYIILSINNLFKIL